MSSAPTLQPRRRNGLSSRTITYALVISLSVLASVITHNVSALHPFPLALNFLAMATGAMLGGFGPALVAVGLSVLGRIYQLSGTPITQSTINAEIVRCAFLLATALLICLMGRRRRLSEARLEVALSELQERSDALVESLNSSKCASWTLDLDAGTLRWYSGSYPVLGRPFTEIESVPALLALPDPDYRPHLTALFAEMETFSGPILSDFCLQWPDGKVHCLEIRGTRIPGRRRRWRGVMLDITERKSAEAALLRSEKLAAVGRLASTVSHEINNPLEAVTNLLYLVHADDSLLPQTRLYVDTAERELARLGNIARLTLGFVRNSGSASSIDLAATVDNVVDIFRHRVDTLSVNVHRHYEPEIYVSISLHELRQVATNLIANAFDALTGPTPSIAIHVRRDQQKAVLLIEDNGDGIASDHLPRIFEPFFSTREEVGTGIGLWVTKEIVERNGGQISVESGDLHPGIHTRFRVELPLAEA